MYDINITGKIIKVKPIETFKTKTGEYKKQNFIVKVDSTFDNFIELTIPNKRINEIEIKEGERAEIKFFINGREWNDKIIHNFNVMKVNILDYKTDSDVKFSSVDGVNYDEPKQPEDDLPF
jgi:hypothetical protein|tara:strand:+ start:2797 stop:3159 length:363 start_codon:yes stop_codon:yes gene_type:complete